MNFNEILKRIYILCVLLFLTGLVIAFNVVSVTSSAMNQINNISESDRLRSSYKRGNFLYSDGSPMTYYNNEGKRVCDNGKIFGSILGYASDTYKYSLLENAFDHYLAYSKRKYEYGNNVVLTLNRDLQKALYNSMAKFDNAAGVVIDAATGEILAMVSLPSYDPTFIDNQYATIAETSGTFFNKNTQRYVPGSVMKLITASMIVRENRHNEIYDDTGSYIGITNYNKSAFGKITMKEALGNSVNTYMAEKSVEIGGFKFEEILQEYMVGIPVKLDFTTLNSEYTITDNGIYSDVDIAYTAFGQGKTLISPLHVCMITGSIANKGQMFAPYIMKHIENPDGKTIEKGKKTKLNKVLNEKECEEIKGGMLMAAQNLGLADEENIYVKTGTAQLGKDDLCNNWITAIFYHNGKKYAFTLAVFETPPTMLTSQAKEIIDALRTVK